MSGPSHIIQPRAGERVADAAALARIVRAARTAQHLRQADLALAAGVSPQFLSALENGKPTVRLDRVIAVLDALNLTLAITGRDMQGHAGSASAENP